MIKFTVMNLRTPEKLSKSLKNERYAFTEVGKNHFSPPPKMSKVSCIDTKKARIVKFLEEKKWEKERERGVNVFVIFCGQ